MWDTTIPKRSYIHGSFFVPVQAHGRFRFWFGEMPAAVGSRRVAVELAGATSNIEGMSVIKIMIVYDCDDGSSHVSPVFK